MLIVSFLPSTADNAWTYIRVLPGLLLIGVGMGIGFPALNVGAMGAVTGQDLGLASGVLNTARQLGAALGVAILIATFGGALHAHMSWFAKDNIDDIVDDYDMPKPMAAQVIGSRRCTTTRAGREDRFVPKPGFDEDIVRETAGSAREGFAWAFRQAALLVLSALPLMGALRRTPAQARAEAMAAQAGQGPPPPSDGAGVSEGSGTEGMGMVARPGGRPPAPSPTRPDIGTVSSLCPHYGPNDDTVSSLAAQCAAKDYTVAWGTPSVPVVKRASTYSTSRRAESSGDSDSVSRVSSAASGSSYGSDTPVNPWILPARARS